MLVTIRKMNERTGESVITGWQGDELITCLSNRHGMFRMGVGNSKGHDEGSALVQNWRDRGDPISIIV